MIPTGVVSPRRRRLGRPWRGAKLPSRVIGEFLAWRKALLLCAGCVHRMPRRWEALHDYGKLPAFHADGRCDGCRQEGPADLFLPLEGGYARQWQQQTDLLRRCARP